jgi:hypothetical protein
MRSWWLASAAVPSGESLDRRKRRLIRDQPARPLAAPQAQGAAARGADTGSRLTHPRSRSSSCPSTPINPLARRRQDEARIKDLSQRIEKVTRQVAQRKEEVEREVTDTQVAG